MGIVENVANAPRKIWNWAKPAPKLPEISITSGVSIPNTPGLSLAYGNDLSNLLIGFGVRANFHPNVVIIVDYNKKVDLSKFDNSLFLFCCPGEGYTQEVRDASGHTIQVIKRRGKDLSGSITLEPGAKSIEKVFTSEKILAVDNAVAADENAAIVASTTPASSVVSTTTSAPASTATTDVVAATTTDTAPAVADTTTTTTSV